MKFAAETSEPYEKVAEEMGMPPDDVMQLISLAGFKHRGGPFIFDNGFYANPDGHRFQQRLLREDGHRDQCIFVVVPDIVGSAQRTAEMFDYWAPRIGPWPLAFAAQDGIEHVRIPWDRTVAIFIGGTTEFKMSAEARAVIRTAQAMGQWVHVGRVNTPMRWDYFEELGVDSVDGTGLSRFSGMRQEIADMKLQPKLLEAAS